MKRLLRSNSKMFITICILTSLVLGLSYAAFKVNTNSYKATNMMVSKLMYALNITEVNKSSSTINNNVIIVPANTKAYFNITISSINKINSKYALAYTSTNTVKVKYSSESESTPTEEINGYTTTNTYSKVVKIYIDNRNNTSSTTVTINAFGGYTHNSYTSIILDSGYTLIEGRYEEGKDINLISYTLNGSVTDKTYKELTTGNYVVNSITCENRSTATWDDTNKTITLSNINTPEYCVVDFKEDLPQFIKKILVDNPTISERTDFSVTNVANTTGTIYKTNKTEDGSDVYYYSGNTTNNWVYFGGYYWRIIRTNEDGSVRLLYAGTSTDTTSAYIGTSAFNSTNNQSRYVGYMYGGTSSLADSRTNTTNSVIKGVIDTWYQNNLLESYDKYISKTAIYCNDRSVGSGDWVNTGGSDFYYGAYTRLSANKTPSYKCGANTTGGLFESTQAVADKFSASTSGGGNGHLTYPIALMTADEVAFAGGKYDVSLSSPYAWYYLNSAERSIVGSDYWWLMSPRRWDSSGYSRVLGVYGSSYPGYLTNGYVSRLSLVRPVVSLGFCTRVTGSGTATDPYVIDETSSFCE